MTLDQLDALLQAWKQRVDLIAHNLTDLDSQVTYQRLAGTTGFPKEKLTGITATRVEPALEAMRNLWEYFQLIVQVVNDAEARRSQLPRFLGAEPKLRMIEQLLKGPSITLPPVSTQFAQRSLLSSVQTGGSVCPDELLKAMMGAYEFAKKAVCEVEAAWQKLEPALRNAETEIRALEQMAQSVGQNADFGAATSRVREMRLKIVSDPLGVQSGFDSDVTPILQRVRNDLEGKIRQRDQARRNIEQGRQLLNRIQELTTAAETARLDCEQKIQLDSPLLAPPSKEQIEALLEWLNRLESKLAQSLIQPVCIGLENWVARARALFAEAEKACNNNEAPLRFRLEQRGLFDALKAKAAGRGMSEDPSLMELAERAKELLYARPTKLKEAEEAVRAYERRLNGLGRGAF